jgi:hypothetical protein
MDISSLQFPTSIDKPVFDYRSGVKGDPLKAQQSYGACLLAGGNSVDCGAKAWQDGAGNSTQKVQKLSDFSKGGWGSGFGLDGGNGVDPNGNTLASAYNWLSNPARIATVIIGIVLIGGALFMFGISSFNPVASVLESAK